MSCVALADTVPCALTVLIYHLRRVSDEKLAEMGSSEDIGLVLKTIFQAWWRDSPKSFRRR